MAKRTALEWILSSKCRARVQGSAVSDPWRWGTGDGIGAERVNNVVDGVSMDLIDGVVVVSLGHGA